MKKKKSKINPIKKYSDWNELYSLKHGNINTNIIKVDKNSKIVPVEASKQMKAELLVPSNKIELPLDANNVGDKNNTKDNIISKTDFRFIYLKPELHEPLMNTLVKKNIIKKIDGKYFPNHKSKGRILFIVGIYASMNEKGFLKATLTDKEIAIYYCTFFNLDNISYKQFEGEEIDNSKNYIERYMSDFPSPKQLLQA